MAFQKPQLSLRMRLGLCFGSMIILLTAVVLIGAVAFDKFQTSSNRLINQEYPKTVVLDDASFKLNAIALAMRNTLFMREKEDLQNQLTIINQVNQQLLADLSEIHQRFKDQNERGLLNKVDIVDSAYRVNQDDFITMVRENRMGEARNLLLVDLHPYQQEYLSLLEQLRQQQRQRILRESQSISETITRVRGWTFSLTLLALLIGIAFTSALTRSLLRQLGGEPTYARDVAQRIAQGEFSYDIKLHPCDKSSLLAIINLMRNSLNQRGQDLENANQEMAEIIQTLRHTQHELVESEKMAALGSLVAGVSHELNTPIGNSVTAASTLHDLATQFQALIKEGQLKRTQLEAYVDDVANGTEILQRNLIRAGDLVSSFKQVAVDRTCAQLREFLLHNLINETLLTLRPTFKKLPIALILDIPEHIVMFSYPGSLSQVISNLLDNAAIHGLSGLPEGSIKISAQLLNQEEVEITVSDNGHGISSTNMPHIFEPFFTTKLGHGGSGLGLHIVYNNVTQILHGKIRVQSEPGKTAFILRLPLRLSVNSDEKKSG